MKKYAALAVLLLAGCSQAPQQAPIRLPSPPQSITPQVKAILPPLLAAKKDISGAAVAVKLLTPKNLDANGPAILSTLVDADKQITLDITLQGHLQTASIKTDVKMKQFLKAVKKLSHSVAGMQKQITALKSQYVHDTLMAGLVIAGLLILGGLIEAFVLKNLIAGITIALCGAGLIGLIWFAAAHVVLIEWCSAGLMLSLIVWLIYARITEAKPVASAPAKS